MSDIVSRLRLHLDNKTKAAMQHDCQQAADEIEKLRAERDEARSLLRLARLFIDNLLTKEPT